MPETEDHEWTCTICNNLNEASEKHCEICGLAKPIDLVNQAAVRDMKFSEEALWSVLGSLELLIDLVSSGYLPNENHVLGPDNISLLVRLMVRAQPQNQILTHKILQCVIEKSEHMNA